MFCYCGGGELPSSHLTNAYGYIKNVIPILLTQHRFVEIHKKRLFQSKPSYVGKKFEDKLAMMKKVVI